MALPSVSKPSALTIPNFPRHKPNTLIIICLLAFFLSGCSSVSLITLPDPETSQEHYQTYISVNPGQSVGQTFIARRPRLNGITLWVNPVMGGGVLQVALFHTPADEIPIFSQVTPFSAISSATLKLNLPPQPDPAGQPYFLSLRPEGSAIRIGGRQEDSYPDGQAFYDQNPQAIDFAFTTSYDYDTNALLGDVWNSLPRLWLVLPLIVILILPGWLLLEGSGLRRLFDGGERIGLSIGLSLAIIPLGMLWCTTLGLRWGRTGLLITSALLLAAAFWRMSRSFFHTLRNWRRLTWADQRMLPKLHNIILLLVFILSLGVRLVMTRDLSAPAWVDSVHHATISRLILEEGGFPTSYAPYILIDATEYHAGFHSLLAVFQWLTELESPEAMLLLGQVLNALIVFAVYLLAVTLTRQPAAGVAAAIVAGLFTPMPAYYTSWGRYTQLAGLLILPTVLALARLLIVRRDEILCVSPCASTPTQRVMVTAAIACSVIACAGLFLVHYRVAGFLALLLASYFISQIRFNRLEVSCLVKRVALFAGVIGLLALILSLPWSWRAITQVIAPRAAIVAGSTAKAFDGFFWEYLTAAWGLPAMVLAGLGLLISLLRKPRLAVTMILWTGLLLLAGNLSALHLPGSWFVNTISVTITLFLPTAVLAGYGLGQVLQLLQSVIPPRVKIPLQWGLSALGVVICLLAARALLPILRPSTDLFRYADRPAMEWIAQNIPSDGVILINPVYWGYGTYAGVDGGFWITPLTGRRTIPPPVLYSLGSPVEKEHIRVLCESVMASASDAETLAEILRLHDIQYVYIGRRGGILSTQALQASQAFEILYAQEGIYIFTLR